MGSEKKKEKLLTGFIIGISVLGIIYFTFNSIKKNSRESKENPFRYPVEKYKTRTDQKIKYTELDPLNVPLADIMAIAVDSKDRLIISGSGSISIYNSDLSLHHSFKSAKTANCIAVKNDKVYLGMTNHIQVYSTKGVLISKWEPVESDTYITSIAISKDSVFVADAENKTVWEYSFSGIKKHPIGRKDLENEIPGYVIPSYFFDLTVDPDGFLWVVNPGRHSLENYTPERTIRTSWGKYSSKTSGFVGCCNPIHFTIHKDGFFITAEKGIARVKIYNRLGDLVSVVAGPEKFDEGTKISDLAVNSTGHIFVADPKRRSIRIFVKSIEEE